MKLFELTKAFVSSLMQALKDDNEYVRADAVKMLGIIGGKEVMSHLIQALKDESWYVRGIAVHSLAKIGKPAVDTLITALQDEHWRVRYEAAYMLGRIGDNRAFSYLRKVAQEDPNLAVRDSAKEALRNARVD